MIRTITNTVRDTVRETGGMTTGEIAKEVGLSHGNCAARLAHLRDTKLISHGGMRECDVNKRPQVTWWFGA